MNHLNRIPRHSTARDFLTYGHEGLEVNRAVERRSAEHARDRINATLRAPGTPSSARRWLGNLLVAIGTGIAGKRALAPHPDDPCARELGYR